MEIGVVCVTMLALDERHERGQTLLRRFRHYARGVSNSLYGIRNQIVVSVIGVALCDRRRLSDFHDEYQDEQLTMNSRRSDG